MIIFGMMNDSVKAKLPPLVSGMIAIPTQIDGHYIGTKHCKLERFLIN
jgi:hypothetical protein